MARKDFPRGPKVISEAIQNGDLDTLFPGFEFGPKKATAIKNRLKAYPDEYADFKKAVAGEKPGHVLPDEYDRVVEFYKAKAAEDRSIPEAPEPLQKEFAREEVIPKKKPEVEKPAVTKEEKLPVAEKTAQPAGEQTRRPSEDRLLKSIFHGHEFTPAEEKYVKELFDRDPYQATLFSRYVQGKSIPEGYSLDNFLKIIAQDFTVRGEKRIKGEVPPVVQKAFEKDPIQRDLFKEIRVGEDRKIIAPRGLDPSLRDYAQKYQSDLDKAIGEPVNAFPVVGQSYADYEQQAGGKSAWDSIVGSVFGESPSVTKENLFTPSQQRLQANLIGLLGENLQRATAPTQVPGAPPIGALPAAPQLNYNLPGITTPLAAPGYQTKLQELFRPGGGFEPIAEEARYRYKSEIFPTIAERFAEFGGAGKTSGYRVARERGQIGLEKSIAALRSQYEERARAQGFQELSTQNQQRVALEQLINDLALRQNAQQLERQQAGGKLGLDINAQRLAEQAQAAGQALGVSELGQRGYGAQTQAQLEANRQNVSSLLSLLNPALQSQTVPVVNPGTPGILQSAAQGAAQAAPYIAAKAFGI